MKKSKDEWLKVDHAIIELTITHERNASVLENFVPFFRSKSQAESVRA